MDNRRVVEEETLAPPHVDGGVSGRARGQAPSNMDLGNLARDNGIHQFAQSRLPLSDGNPSTQHEDPHSKESEPSRTETRTLSTCLGAWLMTNNHAHRRSVAPCCSPVARYQGEPVGDLGVDDLSPGTATQRPRMIECSTDGGLIARMRHERKL